MTNQQNTHAKSIGIKYLHDYLENYKKAKNSLPQDTRQHQSHVSNRVIELAEQIKTWHDTRPIPERWQPVQLGRFAAQFGASRELTASALGYAGWVENRSGTHSFWQPK